MNTPSLEQRPRSTTPEFLVVTQCDDGCRVYSPLNPAEQYLVSGLPDNPQCSCAEFQNYAGEEDWFCKHILAVLNRKGERNHHDGGNGAAGAPAKSAPPPPPPAPAADKPARGTSGATMLIKRSVSPDGRIDSLSVEFSCPVGKTGTTDIKAQAEKTLKLQAEIMEGFLKQKGHGNGAPRGNGGAPGNGSPPPDTDKTLNALPAHMIGVGGMNNKWGGRRLFINILVNGETSSKLFGTRDELAAAVAAVGFPNIAENLGEGLPLDLPCRVTTKRSPDGKYLNVDRVFAASAPARRQG